MIGSVLLYVYRDHTDCLGRGAQDGHLDFHTAPELVKMTKTRILYILPLSVLLFVVVVVCVAVDVVVFLRSFCE